MSVKPSIVQNASRSPLSGVYVISIAPANTVSIVQVPANASSGVSVFGVRTFCNSSASRTMCATTPFAVLP